MTVSVATKLSDGLARRKTGSSRNSLAELSAGERNGDKKMTLSVRPWELREAGKLKAVMEAVRAC